MLKSLDSSALSSALMFGLLCFVAVGHSGAEVEMPRVLDDRMSLELVSQEPGIVTPIGLAFDQAGRLLVIESHTHFPPDQYEGPESDRIRIFERDPDSGQFKATGVFLKGTQQTMSLRAGNDGWIYVATRQKVFRARDRDADGQADEREKLAELITEGDYPHNGLCGLHLSDNGELYFGLGENLGEDYTLRGSDGTEISGGGEGGNIFRCQSDGSGLAKISTGFWNPFGICADSVGRIFTIGNDPDASPPCRLVHVVPGGDYGYQFRYGRSGKHPLQAWDGELPGTLPMVAGTSEAPSSIVLWHGQLYGSSWGEYRVERFTLKSFGATVRADRDVVVQGGNQFRPVDFAVAPDDSLFFTDWVDRSYNIHGRGRIWRLRFKETPEDAPVPAPSREERLAELVSKQLDWETMQSEDPFLRHAAMMALKNSNALTVEQLRQRSHPRERLAILEAARGSQLSEEQRDALLTTALQEKDPDVLLYAVRWIADEGLQAHRSKLPFVLQQTGNVKTWRATLAAIDWLHSGAVQLDQGGRRFLLDAVGDDSRPGIQATALKIAAGYDDVLTSKQLKEIVQKGALEMPVRLEAARSLALSDQPDAAAERQDILNDSKLPGTLRATMLVALHPQEKEGRSKLQKYRSDSERLVSREANRQLSQAATNPTNLLALESVESAMLTAELGDSEAGWAVFFGQGVARCANCHRFDGRGEDVGPDLTAIGSQMTRSRLVQSILRPSDEIAPKYVPWLLETNDGRTFSAMSLGVSNDDETFLTTSGEKIELHRDEVVNRHLHNQSIMPSGIHKILSVQELRDLAAFLSQ